MPLKNMPTTLHISFYTAFLMKSTYKPLITAVSTKNQISAMTHTAQCEIAAISHCIKLTHWMWIRGKNCEHKWKPSVCMWGNSSHILFAPKTVFVPKPMVCTKNHLHIQFTQLLSFWVYNNNGRSINQPCTSVPCSIGQAGWHVQR